MPFFTKNKDPFQSKGSLLLFVPNSGTSGVGGYSSLS
ncbi:hypothetical protein SAMN04488556_4056 [Halostagnicola kamekurae]|uniref:Uncharacterized protein n=1 Tax=Halostagnicola kamekurae TaxID=619731 RepID=A0A1I6USK5_9EURY|nr:hypothetical protein SAMN04488556_4056 [Halostagnicola kamekurae]